MTNIALVAGQNKFRIIAREAGLIVSLTGLTILAARVAIPLPFTPVPATLQVAAVIFAGSACGPIRGVLSQLLYLLIGLVGFGVFADPSVSGPAAFATPSFGYLLAFPLAAYLAGRWTGPKGRWLSAAAGLSAIYALGVAWLLVWASLVGKDVSLAWGILAGILPFLLFDLLKTALAAWSAIPIRRRLKNL